MKATIKSIASAIGLTSYVVAANSNYAPPGIDIARYAYLSVKGGQQNNIAVPYNIDIDDQEDDYIEEMSSPTASISGSASANPSASASATLKPPTLKPPTDTEIFCDEETAVVGKLTVDGLLVVDELMVTSFLEANEGNIPAIEEYLQTICTIKILVFENLFTKPNNNSRKKRDNHEEEVYDIGNPSLDGWKISVLVKSLKNLFKDQENFEGQGLEEWDVSKIEDMSSIFAGASKFNGDIGNWVMESVTVAAEMFENCKSFNQNLSEWVTTSLENCDGMFKGAESFEGEGVENWDLDNVDSVNDIFEGTSVQLRFYFEADKPNCYDQSSIDNGDIPAPFYNTDGYYVVYTNNQLKTQVTTILSEDEVNSTALAFICVDNIDNFIGIFEGLNLTGTKSSNIKFWNTSRGSQFDSMFFNAFNDDITFYLNISRWDMTSATSTTFMFSESVNINPDVTNWDTSQFKYIQGMFSDSSSLAIDVSQWNTDSVEIMNSLFKNCSTCDPAIENWNVGSVTDMGYLFSRSSLSSRNLSSWDTSQVTNMENMFELCDEFDGDISNWDTGLVTNMRYMFNGASRFEGFIDEWDTGLVTTMESMFREATNFNTDISDWDVELVTNFKNMFNASTSFNIDLNDWKTDSAVHMEGMFAFASAFNGRISEWNTSSVVNMSFMFEAASSFNQALDNWDVSSVTEMAKMFYIASDFNQNVCSWNTISLTNVQNMFAEASSYFVDMSDSTCWENMTLITNSNNCYIFSTTLSESEYPQKVPFMNCGIIE